MPISDAREHLAEVVNRAAYSGGVTYLTRGGRRLAAVVPAFQAAADHAAALEEVTVETCRRLWQAVASADEATQDVVRGAIDQLIEHAEDTADIAAAEAARAKIAAGAPTVRWDQVKAELGL
jgi:prevent-host-death family protein